MKFKLYTIGYLCILLTLLIPTAMAGNQFIYFGVAPGYSSTYFNWVNNDSVYGSNPDNDGQSVLNKADSTQIGFFTGYGILVDQIYLGIEGATQLNDRSAKSNTLDYNTQVTLNNKASMQDIYIVDFRPGYVWKDKNSMLYLILGINSANFTATQTDSSTDEVVQDSGAIRRTGIRIGTGFNLGLGSRFLARVEYAYTKFSKFDFTAFYPDFSQVHTWQLNPSSNEVSLGFAVVIKI